MTRGGTSTRPRVLLDTSAVIDLPDSADLPSGSEIAISSITLAELSAGVHAATDARERAVRLVRLQRVEAAIASLSFTPAAARRYGQLYAMVLDAGRNPRPRRMDLLIAAVAAIHQLPLVTRNGADFADLSPILEVIALPGRSEKR
ncbi:type II toxin-antitoxin system VapC family toxin [Amycolatopsis anabasis]|uniref:type II toxin-antitoxin system VapC family toxin n=1 Tax=Amycolatopsis anabasis TaxID=1840409 RepID=UPI00131E8942|nr:type II toxin-antitoxin system VapC family toxin [Amycolatopsis anabasis]